jgi:hypothetical protein
MYDNKAVAKRRYIFDRRSFSMCDLNFLQLRWARFFALAGWEWKLASPYSGFDFQLTIPCGHSEGDGSHRISVRTLQQTLELLKSRHDEMFSGDEMYAEPHPALFGNGPKNTVWRMAHGAEGGDYHLDEWESDAETLWRKAASE